MATLKGLAGEFEHTVDNWLWGLEVEEKQIPLSEVQALALRLVHNVVRWVEEAA